MPGVSMLRCPSVGRQLTRLCRLVMRTSRFPGIPSLLKMRRNVGRARPLGAFA